MREWMWAIMAIAAAACGKKEAAAPVVADPAETEIAAETPPADPAVAAAETYARLEGSWAETGQCADYQVRWEIEPQSFHLFEMRCAIDRFEPVDAGVRAVAQCTVEGDNDNVPDNFQFLREPDRSLTIINESNGARTEGLYPCVESEL